jgi:hypothetical protein
MSTCYQKVKALIATVPIRWGTQAAQLDSILDNQVALQAYATLPDASNEWKETLNDTE